MTDMMPPHRFSKFTSTLCLLPFLAMAMAGSARAVVISGNIADAEPTQTVVAATGVITGGVGVGNDTKIGTLLSGTYRSGTAVNYASISPVFQLPVLTAGQSITAADLRLTLARVGTLTYNTDLWGLGFRSSATALATDFFAGTSDSTDATLIQDDFATTLSGTVAASTNTSASGATALLAYLNAQYLAGGAGNYVFLRLSPDYATSPYPLNPPAGSAGYVVQAADTGSGGSTAATIPQLTLTVVPEPSAPLVLVGAAGLCSVRRRR